MVTKATIDALTEKLSELDRAYKRESQKLFEDAGVTDREYYDAYWDQWRAAHGGNQEGSPAA